MARCLITGSCGFIGSHLVDHLHNEGHIVRGIDNLSTGYGRNTNPNAPTFKLDLFKEEKLAASIVEGFEPDIVYINAAWAHEGLSQFCPNRITQNNYNITLNTLIPAIRAGVKRIVFVSSMSVYGDQTAPFNEALPRKPMDIYAVSKSASERAIELLSEVHGFDYTIIRPHNVYGPRQALSDPYRNVVAIFIRRALEGKSLVIYGNGEQKRAFSYIDDVAPYIAKAGYEPRASKQIINIGPTEEYTINQLADAVIKASGKSLEKEYIPDRPLEVKDAWCTNDKAQEILGYKTSVTLEEGVQNMYDWAKGLQEISGIAAPRYLEELELVNSSTPSTWKDRTL